MRTDRDSTVIIIGGGLAGCEAAYQLLRAGISVKLYDMKPHKLSPAHSNVDNLCELVCSNSLKSDEPATASGLLKAEMRIFGSLILEAAENTRVPAGGALAVDRDEFAEYVTARLKSFEDLTIVSEEVDRINTDGWTIVATGPLTSDALVPDIRRLCGERLYFFDAAAPIITRESVGMTRAFMGGRYGKGGDDYINCPMTKEEYQVFWNELVNAKRAELKDFEKKDIFEGCMPVEVMAARGADTLRFGPLKPVGLTDPKTGKRPYAVVQLRTENREGTIYNLVGFQTNLTFGEQKRVFSLIPALSDAEFVKYGVMHRNTYINSPACLNFDFSMRKYPKVYFSGQISGVEGYIESAMSGMIAGMSIARRIEGLESLKFSSNTMTGALCNYISRGGANHAAGRICPMNANFGILPPLDAVIRDKKEKKTALYDRAMKEIVNNG